MKTRTQKAIGLLQELVRTPSFSGQEDGTAALIASFLEANDVKYKRQGNNIISYNQYFDVSKKSIVLNSHHDTVKVVQGWNMDPFGAAIEDGILYGLGSNDAGASLVSLISVFIHFYAEILPYNLILMASAEEENFGPNGVSAVLKEFQTPVHLGIIGEPTNMHLAIGEKGLMVIDGQAKGIAGHAARDEGDNAIYKATADIQNLRNLTFDKVSDILGKVQVSVTQINAGYQHNIIPDNCHFVIDVRNNECYQNTEILGRLQEICQSTLTPRSLKWKPSFIDPGHPLVQRGIALGRNCFGSPTLSDQVHFSCPTLKIGPGFSERSHTADEYILLDEIEEGIDLYIALLDNLIL